MTNIKIDKPEEQIEDHDEDNGAVQRKSRSLKREIANLQVSNDKEWKSTTSRRKIS